MSTLLPPFGCYWLIAQFQRRALAVAQVVMLPSKRSVRHCSAGYHETRAPRGRVMQTVVLTSQRVGCNSAIIIQRALLPTGAHHTTGMEGPATPPAVPNCETLPCAD